MKLEKSMLVLASILLGTMQAAAAETGAPTQSAQKHDHGPGAEAAAMGKGVVNAIDLAAHKINVSHGPIPSLGWPAMKMDFAVVPSVDLKALQPGSAVAFTVGKNNAGLPEIQSIQTAKK